MGRFDDLARRLRARVGRSSSRENSLDWKAADVIDQLRVRNDALEADNKRFDAENRASHEQKRASAADVKQQIEPQESSAALARAIGLREAAVLLGVSYSTVFTHKETMGFFQVGNQWRVWPDTLRLNLERRGKKETAEPAERTPRLQVDAGSRPSRVTSSRMADQAAAERKLNERLARKAPRRRA